MWEESDVRTPMICFLSMGSDPTASIEALAKKQRLGKHSCHILLINHYFPFKSYLPVSLKYSELAIKKGKQWLFYARFFEREFSQMLISATRRTYLSNTLLLMAQIRVFKRGKVLFISVKI